MSTHDTAINQHNRAPHHYEQLMASIDGIFWEADAHTLQFTYVSEHAERLLGYPLAQWFVPGFWEEQIHPEDRKWAIAFCNRSTRENRSHSFDYRMIAADGRTIWLRDIVSVIVEEDRPCKLRGIMIDITERKHAEEERQAHLWFLESLDRVNQAIQGIHDPEQLMRDVLDTLLEIFACDRAWLLYPCDPDAATWTVPMERTRPEYPGAFAMQLDMPTSQHEVRFFNLLKRAGAPVQFRVGAEYPLSPETMKRFSIQSVLALAIYPKTDRPYIVGLHQCAYPRIWTPQEERLFQEIGRRLGDALTSLLAYRHLQESELRYREVFENTSDIIVIAAVTADSRFCLLDCNPALEKMLGIKREVIVGRFLDEFSAVDELARLTLTHVRQCLEQNVPITFEREWMMATGSWHIDATLIPVCNAAGQIYRVVGIGRNLTAQKRAEDRLRIFLDQATDAFFLHDHAGAVLDVNQQACVLSGYTREELIDMSPLTLDPNLDATSLAEFNRRLTAGETIITESRHRRKDGTVFPIELRIRAVWEGGQQFNVSFVQDITERKRIESELRASEARFRTFVDHATDAFFLQEAGGIIIDVNRQACESLGYDREELVGQFPGLFDSGWTPAAVSLLWQQLNAGEIVTFDAWHRRKNGTFFPVEVCIRPFSLEGHALAISSVRDITERKRADAALKESEERYRILYEDNPTMYFTIDADGTVLSVNRFGAEHLGYTIAELTGRSVLELFQAEDKAAAQQFVRQCIEQLGKVLHWTLRKVRKDGSMLWVEETARAVQGVNGALVLLIVCEDITERKRTEQAVVESHNLLNAIVEGTADMTFAKDRQGRYLMINSAGARLLGKTVAEIIGKDDRDLFPLEVARTLMEKDRLVMASGESQTFEETTTTGVTRTYLTTKGVYRDVHGTVNGIVAISRDITELKRLEEQFRQAQKMEAVGRLAGGVAHDFNNLLTVINGYSQLIFNRLSTDDPNRPRLAEIKKAGERAATLTRQLLAFSRKQVLQPQVIDLNTLLAELIKLLRRLISEDIELVLTPAMDLGLVKIDPVQFEQAIINLAVNARDAMPLGGKLTITLYNTELDADYTEHYPETQAGSYVCITVSDTGVGMADATKARIFEPFFTTKDIGQGTGLGLAMVYGFVKQSGGHIEVFSELGRGTTFTIYLPRTEETGSVVQSSLDLRTIPKGTETILLVEDEDAVRNLVRFVLQAGGYTVLEARDGQKALLLAAQHQGPLHLLITDLVMPQMSGRQLAEHLAQMRPDVRTLFMSGYTEEAMTRDKLRESNIAFLQKPFDPSRLAHQVRELLDAQGKV